MKCKITDHITPILRQLHWLPIQKRICHKIISATYQFMITPPSTCLMFSKNTTLLAFSDQHHVPGPRDSKAKRYGQRVRYVAPSLWNVLPESIKE